MNLRIVKASMSILPESETAKLQLKSVTHKKTCLYLYSIVHSHSEMVSAITADEKGIPLNSEADPQL